MSAPKEVLVGECPKSGLQGTACTTETSLIDERSRHYLLASITAPVMVDRATMDALSDVELDVMGNPDARLLHPDDTRRIIAAHIVRCVVVP